MYELEMYLPWPEAAITAYTVFDYFLALDVSLGKWLIEDMAQWFSPHMHTLKGGLSALPARGKWKRISYMIIA